MNESSVQVAYEHLPFWITGPESSDILFTAVTFALVAILIGFGALYFTIQAIPDRIAEGTSKAQMQVVGLLGLISLFTMNNLYWIIAILLAAIRIPDFVTPLTDIARALGSGKGAVTPEPEAAEPVETSEPPALIQETEVEAEAPAAARSTPETHGSGGPDGD